MDNTKNQEVLDKFMKDIRMTLDNDDYEKFQTLIPMIKTIILEIFQIIIKERKAERRKYFVARLFQNNFAKEFIKINLNLLKVQINVFGYLIIYFDYLKTFDKNILTSYFNILENMIASHFIRNEWEIQNSNVGRTILSNYKLNEIQKHFDLAKNEFDKIAMYEENEIKIKEFKKNGKQF